MVFLLLLFNPTKLFFLDVCSIQFNKFHSRSFHWVKNVNDISIFFTKHVLNYPQNFKILQDSRAVKKICCTGNSFKFAYDNL